MISRRRVLGLTALSLVGGFFSWRPVHALPARGACVLLKPAEAPGVWVQRWKTDGYCTLGWPEPVDDVARAWQRAQREAAAVQHRAWIEARYPGPATGRDSEYVRAVAARKRAASAG